MLNDPEVSPFYLSQKDSFKMPPPKDLMFDAKLIPYVPKNVVEQQIRMIN